MKKILIYLIFLCCFGLTATVWGSELVSSRGVIEDRFGTMSINEVAKADFKPMGDFLSKGFSESVHWIRFVVTPDKTGELLVRINPTILDQVVLYEPDPASVNGWKTQVLGDRSYTDDYDFTMVALEFVVNPSAPETVYYLRLQTTSSSFMLLDVHQPADARNLDYRFVLFQALYAGLLLWLLFWAVSDYVAGRQRVVAWFVLYQSCYILYHLAITGRLVPIIGFIPSGATDVVTNYLVCIMPLTALMFHRTMFADYAPSKPALRALDLLAVLILIELGIMFYGNTQMALHVNALVKLLFVPLFLYLAFSAKREAVPKIATLRLFYILIAVAQLDEQLILLGWIEPQKIYLLVLLFQGIVTSGLMFSLLHSRSKEMMRASEQAQQSLRMSQQQLEIEKRQRREQSRFMDMLNHELKTPLSVIRMAMGMEQQSEPIKQHAIQATMDIDAIIERCLQADQMEQRQLVPKRQLCDINSMLVEFERNGTHQISLQSSPLPRINSDPQLLNIVLGNLIGNAIKYRDVDIPVQLDAQPHEYQGREGVLLGITNVPGVAGMPDPEQVFEKYYRNQAAHGNTGSGIGLYLVRNIVGLLDGWMAGCDTDR
ncbi:7TM-DISM domain-containing protein [Candidatus Reidiella endopervernicosa]|nr:7TM-DISM domain-containing protein [Candidatus Reidiella endopervernicosa]